MADEDDELDQDENLEEEHPEGDEQQGEGEHVEEGEGEKKEPTVAELLAAIKDRGSISDDLRPLIEMGQAFLTKMSAPKGMDKAEADAQFANFASGVRKALLEEKDDAVAGKVIFNTIREITQREIGGEIDRRGAPLAAKAGDYTVAAFLTSKKEAAAGPLAATHDLIAKGIAITAKEKAWLATAEDDEAKNFLERRYKETAGEVLLDSAKRARPRNLGGGSGGGDNRVRQFPDVPEREVRRLRRQVEAFYPGKSGDEKFINEKIREAIEAIG